MLAAGVVAILAASAVAAQPSLSIMRDCASIAELQRITVDRGLQVSGCRRPRTALERRMVAATSGASDIQQCVVARVPSGMSGWTCVRETSPGKVVVLTCLEERDGDDASAIRADYDRYGPAIARYLQDANRCPTSNRDAASTGFELWTSWRTLVQNGPVTFAEKLRSGRRVPDILIEGYALANEDVAGRSRNLHYVILGANWLERKLGAVVDFDAPSHDGPWVIESGDKDPGMAQLNRAFSARLPPQVRIFGNSLEMRRTTVRTRTESDRRELLDNWQGAFADSIERQGYTRLSTYRLLRETGVRWSDLRRKMLDGVPPERRNAMEARLADDPIWLVRTGRSCEAEPNMVVGVMEMYPDPNDPGDYGQLVIYGVSASPCAGEVGRLARDHERAIRSGMKTLEQEIRRTP